MTTVRTVVLLVALLMIGWGLSRLGHIPVPRVSETQADRRMAPATATPHGLVVVRRMSGPTAEEEGHPRSVAGDPRLRDREPGPVVRPRPVSPHRKEAGRAPEQREGMKDPGKPSAVRDRPRPAAAEAETAGPVSQAHSPSPSDPRSGEGKPGDPLVSGKGPPSPSGPSPDGEASALPPTVGSQPAPSPGPQDDQGVRLPPSPAPVLTPPRPIVRPSPGYPDAATVVVRRDDLGGGATALTPEGRVRLRLLVRPDGTVGRVDTVISSGHPALDRAAAGALAQWRFYPATRDGVPIEAYYLVWVVFRLE